MNLNNKNQNISENKHQQSKPQEKIGFQFSSAIKITDPKTKEILLQKRCS